MSLSTRSARHLPADLRPLLRPAGERSDRHDPVAARLEVGAFLYRFDPAERTEPDPGIAAGRYIVPRIAYPQMPGREIHIHQDEDPDMVAG